MKMARIFKDSYDMIKEIDRELNACGITVDISHYQNKRLEGDARFTKELIGVSFVISKPLKKRKEMLEFIFKDDADRIEQYCEQEHVDRTSGLSLNPGNSYKIRQDMWQKFMVDDGTKFDYTYSERMHWQLENLVGSLKEDKHTRQAVMQIFQADKDSGKYGGDTRIPCSVDYQFLIRNDRLHLIYHMRSSDYFGHLTIDLWLSAELMNWVVDQLKSTYPDLKPGGLTYFAGSLHAYKWDLDKWGWALF